jgi:hypothetical protein
MSDRIQNANSKNLLNIAHSELISDYCNMYLSKFKNTVCLNQILLFEELDVPPNGFYIPNFKIVSDQV